MRTQRALFVAPSAYLLGGLATWLDYLLPGLNDLGWESTLGLVAGPNHHRPQAYLHEHPCQNWVEIPCSTGTQVGRIQAIQKALKKVKPDIVLSVNIPDALVATAQASKHTNIRGAMTCHGIQADLFQDMATLHGQTDAIICTNKLACEMASSLAGWETSRVHYAACGTEVPPLPEQKLLSKLTLGYAGRLEQDQKRIFDIPILIQNLKQMGVSCEWLIAGNGPDEAALRSQLQVEIADGSVCFLGHVPASDLDQKFYSKIDGLLVPSSWETGPIVIWEALAKGIPVLTSRYIGSGLEAALQHQENCLMFEIGDMQKAAELIAELENDSPLYRNLQVSGWKLVSERYSLQVSIQHWDVALKAILASPVLAHNVKQNQVAATGRLGRMIGENAAEKVRQFLGRTAPDTGPSGEWPHRLSRAQPINNFWETASQLDRATSSVKSLETRMPTC